MNVLPAIPPRKSMRGSASGPDRTRAGACSKAPSIISSLREPCPKNCGRNPEKKIWISKIASLHWSRATKNPQILYARSAGNGLVRSEDRGETWAAVNGGLTTPDAMAVRSVAVHPENSSIVLRAGGSVVEGVLKSGLWRSVDGGKSWKLVTREIDFDGRGPTTLFGEVIMFCPYDPKLVVAGGETKGLFISRGRRRNLDQCRADRERITSMAFSPQPDKHSKAPTLVVGTFADSEFESLGLASRHQKSRHPHESIGSTSPRVISRSSQAKSASWKTSG